MPARRPLAAIGATIAIAAGSLALAPAAQADGSASGQSTATVLRTGLDVSLLNKTVNVPLDVTLNDVHAPADVQRTALSAQLDGVDDGHRFDVLRAEVATARATADSHRAQGYANLVNARVYLPGLPLLALVEIKQATSKATCDAGSQPSASSNVLGDIKVLGQRVSLAAGGSTNVHVAGVGNVHLDLSKTSTTSATAAATALHLKVAVNPLKLNVAEVKGDVTLVRATCQTPGSSGSTGGSGNGGSTSGSGNGGSTSGSTSGSGNGGSTSGSTSGSGNGGSTSGSTSGSGNGGSTSGAGSTSGSGTKPQTGGGSHLAETGSSSSTPYIAAGAVALVAAGGGVVYTTRRRRAARSED